MGNSEAHIRHGRLPGWVGYLQNSSLGDFDISYGPPTESSYPFNYTLSTVDIDHLYPFNFTTGGNTSFTSPAPDIPDHRAIKKVAIYVASLMILLCAASLVVNVVILSSICFIRSRVNNTLYISLSLAAADTFSLLFFVLGLLLMTLLPRSGLDIDPKCVYLLIEALRMGAIMTNMFHLAALAFNHYVGILFPLKVVTRRNIQYLMVVLWTVPSTLIIMDMFLLETDANPPRCYPNFLSMSKFRMRFSIPFFTTLGLMIFIYLHIYRLVCRHQNQPFDTKWGYRHQNNQVTKKAIVTTIMILGSTILGWLPPFTFFALFCDDCLLSEAWAWIKDNPALHLFIGTINQFLLIIKPATNFYIYAYRMKEIRGALRRMKRRLIAFIRHPQSGGSRIEMTDFSLTRARSRTSTFRRDTCSVRVTSHHEPGANGVSQSNMSLRRCRSSAMSRHKPSNTSV